MVCLASYKTTAADVTARAAISETVFVGLKDGTGVAVPERSVSKSIAFTPLRSATLTVAAAAQTSTPASFSSSGTAINYTFDVRNTGNIDITSFTLSDTRVTSISCPATTIARGASLTCTGATQRLRPMSRRRRI